MPYTLHMSLSIGIVGLPNVGKSTLFNAILKKQQALTADYPFTTIEPNIGIAPVPDNRLKKLQQALYPDSPLIYSTVKFIDIAGLVKGAHQGEGLGNQFLAHIREVDLILHLIKNFGDHPTPKKDLQIINAELKFAQLGHKPQLIIHNSDSLDTPGVSSNALTGDGVDQLIKACFKKLNLISFFTIKNGTEVRAWPIPKNLPASQAAGTIHSDFEKNFIKALIINYQNLIQANSWSNAKKQGLIATRGRNHIVNDADVIEFLTSAPSPST
jgi:small GTP-binding protein